MVNLYSYLLVRIRLWQNSFAMEEDCKENTKYRRISLARRTDKICFCLSLFLNAVFLICNMTEPCFWCTSSNKYPVKKTVWINRSINVFLDHLFSQDFLVAVVGLRQQKYFTQKGAWNSSEPNFSKIS